MGPRPDTQQVAAWGTKKLALSCWAGREAVLTESKAESLQRDLGWEGAEPASMPLIRSQQQRGLVGIQMSICGGGGCLVVQALFTGAL